MTNQQLTVEQRIEKYRIDILYKRSKTATLTLLVISTIYIYILLINKKFDWLPLISWYLVLIAVLFGRWLIGIFYVGDQGQTRSLSFWLYIFRLGILSVGLTIGSLNLFFFSQEPLSFVLLAIILPYGIMAGAATVLHDYYSFFLYVTTLMIPVVYQTALAGDRPYAATGAMTCLLIIFFLKFSKEYNNNFILTTRQLYKNKVLLENLEEEKNTLNNRLVRILNDSSTETFIADAETLNCLQVNQGAIDNLGYSKDEFTGINLLDIFTDLDRKSLTALLAPLYNDWWKVVVHYGVNRRKDGSTYPVEARLQLSTLDVPHIIVASAQNITERKNWEEKLIYQANYDQLTGLFNRHYMQSYMNSAFTRARRYKKKVALLYIDLDNFKNINDTLGHDIGDEVLKQTANRISSMLRESDTASRTGGDEFTVVLESLEENASAEVVARKLVTMFQVPFTIKGQEIYCSVSIGISIYPDDGTSLNQIMQNADMAMYQAKDNGLNKFCFFSNEMRRFLEDQVLISNHLRFSLANDELSIFFQPKIDISRNRIVGAEALLRWHNHELGDISADVFIPLAEKLGLINEIGTWVLESACQEAMRWQEFSSEKLHVSVNVSPQQFRTGILLLSVERALMQSGLPADRLELEITENLLMHDSDKPLIILKTLHDLGISLALDDFGTGYSSLNYLRHFPLQVLKIDRSFIGDLETSENSRALVDAIIAMSHSLELEIVAEGVENNNQLDFLRQRGVKIIQGYLFSPPVSADKFLSLLKSYQ